MDNPGDYSLLGGAAAINTTLDRATGARDALAVDLSGMVRCGLVFDFRYGSGGAPGGCSGIVQSGPSCDLTKWYDVARLDFGQVNRSYRRNLEVLLSVGGEYADLAAEGFFDGLLMSRLRAVLIVGATPYVNTTLSIIATPS